MGSVQQFTMMTGSMLFGGRVGALDLDCLAGLPNVEVIE